MIHLISCLSSFSALPRNRKLDYLAAKEGFTLEEALAACGEVAEDDVIVKVAAKLCIYA